MDIQAVLQQLDELFAQKKIEQVEVFLTGALEEAIQENNTSGMITILNELIGFYRDTSEHEKALLFSDKVLGLMQRLNLTHHISYATTMLNVANAYRAAHLYEESLSYYHQVLPIYHELLEEDDILIASYYNNLSLLQQEMEHFEDASKSLQLALAIVEQKPEEVIKVATTHGNLAITYTKMGALEQAKMHAKKALLLFEEQQVKENTLQHDFHYSIALAAMGDVYMAQCEYEQAIPFYEEALIELESNVGRNDSYQRVFSNLTQAYQALNKEDTLSGLSLAKEYYERYGKQMLQSKFPEYYEKIAVGLVGEGSDCYGLEDVYSVDHDYGPGFCMWVSDEVYDKIGDQLQEVYDHLPQYLHGISKKKNSSQAFRVGVFKISEFYESLTGFEEGPNTLQQWLSVQEYQLAVSVNGEVFYDPQGVFTQIRQKLEAYYPEEAYTRKLAQSLANMCQTGQYNYPRMWKRGEVFTAEMLKYQFIQHTLDTLYLLERMYAPHEKWKSIYLLQHAKHEETKEILVELQQLLFYQTQSLEEDKTYNRIEYICKLMVTLLNKQEVTETKALYLEDQAVQVQKNRKAYFVEEIVRLEWEAFDLVKNEGGRASCQDDYATFSIMRKSQYLTWPKLLLKSYYKDLLEAKQQNRNLIMEKYAWMMKSTNPSEFESKKAFLPAISPQKEAIIEQIVEIQVSHMEAFAKEYPKMAQNARILHTKEDTPYDTSYETYLRGELCTYSDATLLGYGRFLAELSRDNQNIAKLIMTNTALLYGYRSLQDAETRI